MTNTVDELIALHTADELRRMLQFSYFTADERADIIAALSHLKEPTMTEQIHDTSDPYIVNLLNIACSNPAYAKVWGKTFGRESEKGYSTYRVETHCTAVTYTAKVIDRDHNGTPTRYRIIHRDYEAC